MPSFARALDEKCSLSVGLVQDGGALLRSRVYVCSGFCRFVFEKGVLKMEKKDSLKNGFNPDIDTLVRSAYELKDNFSLLGVILTGIGSDGALGCSKLLDAGGRCLAESQKSAVIFGMPKNAKEINDKVELMDLEKIIDEVVKFGNLVG